MPAPYNARRLATHSGLVKVLAFGVLSTTGCYTERTFVESFQEQYCPALFTCYDTLEADCDEVRCLFADERTCDTTVAGWYADGAGACADGERFDAGEARACLDDLQRFDCVELTAGRLPPSCDATCQ